MSPQPTTRPDVIVIMTDEERAAPPYESGDVAEWRRTVLSGATWFEDNAVNFRRHYTGSLACVPSRPTIFTGQYPEVHGVTQTDGLGKMADDSRMRWLPEGEVPTLGHWFRTAGYDTHYDGKWHLSHADLHDAEGNRVDANDDDGNVLAAGVEQYRNADRLDPFGFSGWIGPEPHGGKLRDAGVRRDPLIADRVVAWLTDRYERRAVGDAEALRPFLLVASFVNPHDIVLFPAWARRGNPLEPSPFDPPHVPEAPTQHEDLATKPAAQIAYRDTYPSGYGPVRAVAGTYSKRAQEYRDLYHRLHAEVDAPLDRVRRAVTEEGADAVIVRTSDHGDLLGAHGGLHQKWFNLYDEATRVPFSIARVGMAATNGAIVDGAPTSHVDIVPTLLAAAGIDESTAASVLATEFTEVHPLPGTNLMPVVDEPSIADRDRPVYLMTNDNMLEGDSGASGVARRLKRTAKPPLPLRINTPAHVASNFEGLVHRIDGTLWKLVRVFDDPATWTEPGVRHLAASGGPGPDTYRSEPLPDQWELYDLDHDPIEAHNRWHEVGNDSAVADVFDRMCDAMKAERARAVPERNHPWPYAPRRPTAGPMTKSPPAPARAARKLVQKLGHAPGRPRRDHLRSRGQAGARRGDQRGLARDREADRCVRQRDDRAVLRLPRRRDGRRRRQPTGGMVAVDPKSLRPVIRTAEDDRFLVDDEFRAKVSDSQAIGDLDMSDYDIVFLAGGWGAAFDFGFSEALGEKMTEANAAGLVMGGVCHGPLGLINAKAADGSPLVAGARSRR